jgi:hypothetical protein
MIVNLKILNKSKASLKHNVHTKSAISAVTNYCKFEYEHRYALRIYRFLTRNNGCHE